jgi:glucose-1-phosphate cytidylyltransferase
MTDAVILCGGRGTRLYPQTLVTPKPLARIGDRPIVELIMMHLRRYGLRRFVLCLGHQGDAIAAHFASTRARAEAEREGYEVVCVATGADTATGGRLKRVEAMLHTGRVLVVYGDVLSDVDTLELFAFHEAHGRSSTVTAVRPQSPFGHILLDGDRARGFVEKPMLDDWVNIGYVVLERTVLNRLDVDSPALEPGVFADLARDGEMSVYRHHGVFEPMNTVADHVRLNRMRAAGDLDWLQPHQADGAPVR